MAKRPHALPSASRAAGFAAGCTLPAALRKLPAAFCTLPAAAANLIDLVWKLNVSIDPVAAQFPWPVSFEAQFMWALSLPQLHQRMQTHQQEETHARYFMQVAAAKRMHSRVALNARRRRSRASWRPARSVLSFVRRAFAQGV
eukprot:6201851-Pleurochrysis_carterae.AAC.3